MSLEKLLGIAFMCHQRPDRSFFIGGRKLPLCARCTGILLGYAVGIVCAAVSGCRYYLWFLILLIPMIADGAIQHLAGYESTNIRRLITGIMGGVGIVYLFISIHMFTVWWVLIVLDCIM